MRVELMIMYRIVFKKNANPRPNLFHSLLSSLAAIAANILTCRPSRMSLVYLACSPTGRLRPSTAATSNERPWATSYSRLPRTHPRTWTRTWTQSSHRGRTVSSRRRTASLWIPYSRTPFLIYSRTTTSIVVVYVCATWTLRARTSDCT